MKRLPWITALLLMSASPALLAAPDSCERVKSDIQQKIINNGVPEALCQRYFQNFVHPHQ